MQKEPFSQKIEYRYFDFPVEFPVIALLQDRFQFPPEQNNGNNFLHLHNCLEIGYYFDSGSTLRVENKFINFKAGDITIVPPFATHISYREENQFASPLVAEYLYFDPQSVLEEVLQGSLGFLEFFRHDFPAFPYVICKEECPGVSALVLAILNAIRNNEKYCQQEVTGLILALMVQLTRILPPSVKNAEATDLERSIFSLTPCMRFINENYSGHISPQALADLCHMSVTHFRRVFKKTVGSTPLEYIHQVRIRKAKEMLYSTESSILTISLAVGYESISGFNRHFVALTNATPSKWRNEVRSIRKNDLFYSKYLQTESNP